MAGSTLSTKQFTTVTMMQLRILLLFICMLEDMNNSLLTMA